MKAVVLLVVCMTNLGQAHAGEFQRIYEAALINDAAYQAARAELESARQNLPMAQAGMMPNLALSISDARITGTRTASNTLGQPVTSELDYGAPNKSLNLRVPLLNREATQKINQAQAQVSYAEAIFTARQSDLLERLTTAVLQRALALQGVQMASVQVDAAQVQSRQMRRRWELGEGTKPDEAESAAMLELAHAQLLEAQSQVKLAELSLGQMAGSNWLHTSKAISEDPVDQSSLKRLALPIQSLDDLLAVAESGNPAVMARHHAVTIAQAVVARSRAGHYPRLDLVASASNTRNDSLSTLNQSANQRSVGLQLNIPIFSGGYVNASVTQALAELAKAEAELTAEQQSVAREVSKFYFAVVNGVRKMGAYRATVTAARSALAGLLKGQAAGFNTAADVATGRRKLEQTRLDWLQAGHETMLASVKLQVRTGASIGQVVAQIDEMLEAHGDFNSHVQHAVQ